MSYSKILRNGITKENPVFVLLLGLCPALAITTSFSNALGIGISTMIVLIISNIAISALRKVIPKRITIVASVIIIAGFTSVIDMLMNVHIPTLSASLGIFVPLITVNGVILSRARVFASKNGVVSSAFDGLSMGIGFTLALCIIAFIRELFGAGAIWGMHILDKGSAASMFLLPSGGFIVLGIIVGVVNYYKLRSGSDPERDSNRPIRKIDKDKLRFKIEGGV